MKDSFGEISWHKEDLVNALEVNGYPATESNIAKLRSICEDGDFIACMIEAGWQYMYNNIDNNEGWEEE